MSARSASDISALVAAKRIALLGRDQETKAITDIINGVFDEKRFKSRKPILIYLQGKGGIGKTHILNAIREQYESDSRVIVSNHLVDLYHLDYQTPFGLANAIAESLGRDHFQRFYKQKMAIEKAQLSHDYVVAERLEEEALDAWRKDLNQLAGQKPVIIVLDTLEVFAGMPRDTDSSAEQWLIEVIGKLHNPVIFLAAGRGADVFGHKNDFLEKIPARVEKEIISVGPLAPEHCREYLEKTLEFIPEDDFAGRRRIRRFLDQKTDEEIATLTRGEPLMLALVADILRVTGNVPPENSTEDFNKTLIQHLMETEYPASRALFWLGWLPKGGNAALLARLMAISQAEAESVLRYLSSLAIVKHRGVGYERPFFLHDEIYGLVRRYTSLSEKQREHWHTTIERYYNQEIKRWKNTTDELSQLANQALQQLQAERLHYRLYYDPKEGFGWYYAFRGDAIEALNQGYRRILLNETWRTLQALQGQSPEVIDQWQADDQKFLPVEEAIKKGQDLVQCEKDINSLALGSEFYQRIHRPLWKGILYIKLGRLKPARTQLDAALNALERKRSDIPAPMWRYALGMIHNYIGYLSRLQDYVYAAMEHYKDAIAAFRRLQSETLPRILPNLAYAEKLAEHNRSAWGHLQDALTNAQKSEDFYFQARVYNIQSILYLFETKFREAEESARQALEAIQRTSRPVMEGLIRLNLGRIHRYRWNPKAELDDLQDWHRFLLKGLAYVSGTKDQKQVDALANQLHLTDSLSEFKQIVNESSARDAVELLDEKVGRYEALNEAGSLWREICWVLKKTHKDKSGLIKTADNKTVHYYLKAAGIPDNLRSQIDDWEPYIRKLIDTLASPYWPLWSLTNLNWHIFYQKPPKDKRTQQDIEDIQQKIDKIADLILAFIPNDYRLDPPGGDLRAEPLKNKKDPDANLMLWKVLAKLEMLLARSRLLLSAKQNEHSEAQVEQAVHHWLRSLEYNALLGDNSYDFHRAEANLKSRIQSTPDWESTLLPRIYKAAERIEKAYKFDLGESHLSKFLHDRYGDPDHWKAV